MEKPRVYSSDDIQFDTKTQAYILPITLDNREFKLPLVKKGSVEKPVWIA